LGQQWRMACSPWCTRWAKPVAQNRQKAYLSAAGDFSPQGFREVGLGGGRYEKASRHDFLGDGMGRFSKGAASSWLSSQSCVSACAGFSTTLLVCLATYVVLVLRPQSKATAASMWPQAVTQSSASTPRPIPIASEQVFDPPSRGVVANRPAPETICGSVYNTRDATAEDIRSWPQEKRDWCCRHHGKACTTTTSAPFDCQAGLVDWETGWAQPKKDWCCEHGGNGCPSTTTDAYDCSGDSTGWSFGRRYWCCWHRDAGCNQATGRHFDDAQTRPGEFVKDDCRTGFPETWSVGRRSWCCRHWGLGCPDDGQLVEQHLV